MSIPMRVYPSKIPEILTVVFDDQLDDRGWFSEIYNTSDTTSDILFPTGIKQVSMSASRAGVVRGLHYQPGMAKLMLVIRGMARIVNVDTRRDSPTYKQCVTMDIMADMRVGVYAPDWCARGFVAIEPDTQILYLHSDIFSPDDQRTINPFDPTIRVDWGLPRTVRAITSDKDRLAPFIDDVR